MYGYVYLTTNLINGRKYIGQHHSSVFTESYKGSGLLICKAIDKYGWDNFKVELLEECSSREELNEKERYWIKKFDASNSDEFYNISEGGGCFPAGQFPENTRKKLSQKLIGNTHASGPMSEETYKKHVERCRLRGKDPKFRKKLSESQLKRYENPESRRVLSDSHKGKPSNTKGKIWITNGESNTLVNNELEIPEGWYKGKTMKEGFSEIVRRTHADMSGVNNPCYGKIAVNNGCYNKFIYESQLEEYMQLGFTKGLLRSKKSDSTQ